MNKKAKYFLKDIDFSGEGAHLAYTLGDGAASYLNDAILLKTDNLDFNEEVETYIVKFKQPVLKAEMFNNTLHNMLDTKLKQEYRDGIEWVWLIDFNDKEAIFTMGDDKTFKVSYTMEGDQIKLDDQLVQVIADTRYVELKKSLGEKPAQQEETEASRLDNVIEKSNKEEIMTQEATKVEKVEIDKAQLDNLMKGLETVEALRKAAEQKDEVIKALQADKEARDLADVQAVTKAFAAVEDSVELAKAIFAIKKTHNAEAATVVKALIAMQKATDALANQEVGIEGTDEVSVVESDLENDAMMSVIKAAKGV